MRLCNWRNRYQRFKGHRGYLIHWRRLWQRMGAGWISQWRLHTRRDQCFFGWSSWPMLWHLQYGRNEQNRVQDYGNILEVSWFELHAAGRGRFWGKMRQ